MRLVALEPQFLQHRIETAGKHHGRPRKDGSTQWGGFPTSVFHPVAKLRDAHGICFLCPLCFHRNGGAKGTHSVRVYFTGSPVPKGIGTNADGKTVRWAVSGKRYADLTLSPSIQIQGETTCQWHGHVQNGQIVGGIPA